MRQDRILAALHHQEAINHDHRDGGLSPMVNDLIALWAMDPTGASINATSAVSTRLNNAGRRL
jgi:hypothetical protein